MKGVVSCGFFLQDWLGQETEERLGWQVCTLTGHTKSVIMVAFSPDGTRIVSGSHDNLVKIWKIESGEEVSTLASTPSSSSSSFSSLLSSLELSDTKVCAFIDPKPSTLDLEDFVKSNIFVHIMMFL